MQHEKQRINRKKEEETALMLARTHHVAERRQRTNCSNQNHEPQE